MDSEGKNLQLQRTNKALKQALRTLISDESATAKEAEAEVAGDTCVPCSCSRWSGENYSDCRPVTDANPCSGYCVQCEADGVTAIPGFWTEHEKHCAGEPDNYNCPVVVQAGRGTDWVYPQNANPSRICSSKGHGRFIRYACGTNSGDVSTNDWESIQWGPFTSDDFLGGDYKGHCNCCCNCHEIHICCEASQEA